MQLGVSLGIPSTLGKVAAAFSPLDLSPVLWLDAADTSTITEVAGAVSQWDDKSGNGNHVTQATAAKQPTTGTRTINGLNVLDFDGSADYMTAGDKFDVLTGGITIMAVAQMDTTAGGDGIAGKWTGGGVPGNYLLARSSVDDKLLAAFTDGAAREARQSTTYTSTTATVFGLRLRRDNAAGIQLWRDGTFVASGATVGTTSYNNANVFLVGTITTAVSFIDGTIAELVVVQSDLSDSDMTALNDYLNAKWAVY